MNTEFIPREKGFRFPAEWTPHRATWVTLPLIDESWPGMMDTVYDVFFNFLRIISLDEVVAINVHNEALASFVIENAANYGINKARLEIYLHPSNDCWARDHGPAFLKDSDGRKIIVKWKFNAWGNKFVHDLDEQVPLRVGSALNLPVIQTNMVMEGGAVDFNGKGSVLTTRSCLLNPNRNPGLAIGEIESRILDFYGADQVFWLEEGIAGDDTDGHIDDVTRFVNEDTVVTMVETNKKDPNYLPLSVNRKLLSGFRLPDGKQLNVIDLPMPPPVYYGEERLPASYANFYLTNNHLIVPVFQTSTDDKALEILSACFPTRNVIGLDSRVLIQGSGSFHCLSQQEPR